MKMDPEKILGFFVGKGLLVDPKVAPYSSAILDLKHVLEAAEEIEPRILEVLPAALLHFPRAFRNKKALPEDLVNLIEGIRRGEERKISYKGIRYQDMKRWADRQLKDKRTKPISEMKIRRAYRFHPETVKFLRELSIVKQSSDTEILESLVERAYLAVRKP
jgi:hypothetical protein